MENLAGREPNREVQKRSSWMFLLPCGPWCFLSVFLGVLLGFAGGQAAPPAIPPLSTPGSDAVATASSDTIPAPSLVPTKEDDDKPNEGGEVTMEDVSRWWPLLALLPLAAGLGAAWWFSRKRPEMQLERVTFSLPDGAVPISVRGLPEALRDESGRIMLVLVGTFAKNLGIGLLAMLERCELEGVIGSVLLIEMDVRRMHRFMQAVPSVFHDRIVAPSFPALSGGLGNRKPDDVMNLINRWGAPVIYGAEEVGERHLFLHQGQEPALCLVAVSPGGQAITGVKAVETIARRFPLCQFYGLTALPVDDRLRARVPQVLRTYQEAGVQGFVASDNLRDEVTNDFGMVASIVGFAAAAENADAAMEQNNAWYLLFTEAPGGLVSYSTYVANIPGYLLQAGINDEAIYYVYRDSVVSHITTGLEQVRDTKYDALGHNGSDPTTSRFDIALAAVVAEDLKTNEDQVLLGQHLLGQEKRNYRLLVAPISTHIDPAHPLCPVVVVSLTSVSGGLSTLGEVTAPPGMPPGGLSELMVS